MTANRSLRDILEAIHDHLVVFELPDPYSVWARHRPTKGQKEVSVHLDTDEGLAAVAAGLVAWVDTLSADAVSAWQPTGSDSVHFEVMGRLAEGTTLLVWAGVPADAVDFEIQPGQRITLSFDALRALAEVQA
jgi:hypothetical protein